MYYADEPKKAKNRLPVSREIRTLGVVSGIALPFMPIICLMSLGKVPLFVLTHLLCYADITVLVVCLINPVTPKRKKISTVVAFIIGSIAVAILVCVYLMHLGVIHSFLI